MSQVELLEKHLRDIYEVEDEVAKLEEQLAVLDANRKACKEKLAATESYCRELIRDRTPTLFDTQQEP